MQYLRRISAGSILAVVVFVAPTPAVTKLACVGNSITQLSGYTTRLQTLLGSGYQVFNNGQASTCLLKSGENPYWTSPAFQSVFIEKPSIITIKLGTNDSRPESWQYASQFVHDYNALIDTFLTIQPAPHIWLVLCTPAFVNGYNIHGDTIDQKIVPLIRSVATQRGLPIIDCHTPLLNHPECFSDGVHPTAAGADSIAHIFYRTLLPVTAAIAPRAESSARTPERTHSRLGLVIDVAAGERWDLTLGSLDGRALRRISGRGRTLVSTGLERAAGGCMIARLRTEATEFSTVLQSR